MGEKESRFSVLVFCNTKREYFSDVLERSVP